MRSLSEARIDFVNNLYLETVNYDTKTLQRMKLICGDGAKIFCEDCMARMKYDLHIKKLLPINRAHKSGALNTGKNILGI
jgi:hypothetical protein